MNGVVTSDPTLHSATTGGTAKVVVTFAELGSTPSDGGSDAGTEPANGTPCDVACDAGLICCILETRADGGTAFGATSCETPIGCATTHSGGNGAQVCTVPDGDECKSPFSGCNPADAGAGHYLCGVILP